MTKTEIFIEKAKKVHVERYDYSKTDYVNNSTPVLIGYNGNFYKITPANHLKGSNIEKMKTFYDLNKFIDKSNSVHNFKYDYTKTEFRILKEKVWIKCKSHGDFYQKAIEHIKGHGCPKCGKESFVKITRKKPSELTELINIKWKNRFEYINLNDTITTKTLLKIICPKHGLFEKSVGNHLHYGCNKCSHELLSQNSSFTQEEIIDKFNKKWNNFYDYSKFEYVKYTQKSIIICPIHGEFQQAAQHHMKSGCKSCGYEYISTLRRFSKEEFIEKCISIHGNYYDYSKVEYKNSRTEIKIICPKHGEFKQKSGSHLMGYGCKTCCESRGEKIIRIFLENEKIEYTKEKKFEGCENRTLLPFDFYLPKYNMLIEFDGIQHFQAFDFFGGEEALESLKLRDEIKTNFCKENNINLLRISYKEINKIEEILKISLKINE
jgi:hypothetical protein